MITLHSTWTSIMNNNTKTGSIIHLHRKDMKLKHARETILVNMKNPKKYGARGLII
jgi:hypothetical protein